MGAAGGIGECIDTIVVGVIGKEGTLVDHRMEVLVAASILVTGVLLRT